jgi:hypothetical protein
MNKRFNQIIATLHLTKEKTKAKLFKANSKKRDQKMKFLNLLKKIRWLLNVREIRIDIYLDSVHANRNYLYYKNQKNKKFVVVI